MNKRRIQSPVLDDIQNHLPLLQGQPGSSGDAFLRRLALLIQRLRDGENPDEVLEISRERKPIDSNPHRLLLALAVLRSRELLPVPDKQEVTVAGCQAYVDSLSAKDAKGLPRSRSGIMNLLNGAHGRQARNLADYLYHREMLRIDDQITQCPLCNAVGCEACNTPPQSQAKLVEAYLQERTMLLTF